MAKESPETREPLERELAEAKERRDELAARWSREKAVLERVKDATRRIDELRMEAERAERDGNLQRVAEIRYGEIPELEQVLERPPAGRAARQGGGRRGRHRDGRRALDGHPGRPAARGRDREADPHGGAAAPARDRSGGGRRRRRERASACAHRSPGSESPDRLVRLPRPDRRRQDRARACARRVHVRRRARDGADRHERVPGAAHRRAPDRRAARLHRVRRGRAAHRGGASATVLRAPARRDREGASRGVRRAAAGARRRAADRRPGPHGRLPQHGADHDVEHPQRRGDARVTSGRSS